MVEYAKSLLLGKIVKDSNIMSRKQVKGLFLSLVGAGLEHPESVELTHFTTHRDNNLHLAGNQYYVF